MSGLRRIVQNRTSWNISEAVRNLKIRYPIGRDGSLIPYPLGRDASSLPKLYPNVNTRYIDHRPICLRDRVTTMLQIPDLDAASELSRLAVLDEFRDNDDRDTVFICNSVIGAMCEAKRYDEATSLFNYFFNDFQALPNMLSCNLLIKACCDRHRLEDALELYDHVVLHDRRFSPRILTKALVDLVDARRLEEALYLVLSWTTRTMSPSFDLVVLDTLIRGFLEADNFDGAEAVVEEFGRDDHNALTIFTLSMMEDYFKHGIGSEAARKYFAVLDEFQLLEQPFARNKALKVFMEHGKKTEAWDLFKNIIEICDAEAVDIMWDLCCENNVPFHRFRKTCYTTILARLCEQGNISEAEKIFAEIEQEVVPDVSTFRLGEMIIEWRIYCSQGKDCLLANNILDNMRCI